jgi:hypothetical protein
MTEKAYMGKGRAKMWTYLIVAGLILAGAIVANLAIKDPTAAREGFKSFLGLPSWLMATIFVVLGAVIYFFGLKVETDWPEFIGAALITTGVVMFEFVIGWKRIEMGLIVVPYVIPIAVFLLLMMIGMKKSV